MKNTALFFIAFLVILSFGFSQTVIIGTQTWTSLNLDVVAFRNGDVIPQVKTNEEWEVAGNNKQAAWCYYDNDPANGPKYGKLYNWYAVNDPRGLAPTGWHVPTDEEWTVLSTFLGGEEVAGTKMKILNVFVPTKISYIDEGGYYSNNWVSCSNCKVASDEYKKICPSCKGMGGKSVQGKYIPKTKIKVEIKEEIIRWNGDNSSGFSGLPSGYRYSNGDFVDLGNVGFLWSASEDDESAAWRRHLWRHNLYRNFSAKSIGFSVRCVKD